MATYYPKRMNVCHLIVDPALKATLAKAKPGVPNENHNRIPADIPGDQKAVCGWRVGGRTAELMVEYGPHAHQAYRLHSHCSAFSPNQPGPPPYSHWCRHLLSDGLTAVSWVRNGIKGGGYFVEIGTALRPSGTALTNHVSQVLTRALWDVDEYLGKYPNYALY
jgi:hypothetical protein